MTTPPKDVIAAIADIPLFDVGEKVTVNCKCEVTGTVLYCTRDHCTIVWDEPGRPTMRFAIDAVQRTST